MSREYRIETKCIQSGWKPKKGEPRMLPIIQSTTFLYENSDQMGRLFDLEDEGYDIDCGGKVLEITMNENGKLDVKVQLVLEDTTYL